MEYYFLYIYVKSLFTGFEKQSDGIGKKNIITCSSYVQSLSREHNKSGWRFTKQPEISTFCLVIKEKGE